MIVFAGRPRDAEKYVGCEFEEAWMKEESGLLFEAAGEVVVALKARRARGATVRERWVGLEDRNNPEAVEAARRVRDAIVGVVVVMTGRASTYRSSSSLEEGAIPTYVSELLPVAWVVTSILHEPHQSTCTCMTIYT